MWSPKSRSSVCSRAASASLPRRSGPGLWLLFVGASGAQDVPKAVVAFVARILERRLRRILREVHRERPRLRPRRRVLVAHRPLNGLRRGRPEPFDEAQLLARAPIRGALEEVRGLDDQGVAVPAAARIAHIGTDAGSNVRAAVKRNDTRLMDHLVADGHEAGTLMDLVRIAVDGR